MQLLLAALLLGVVVGAAMPAGARPGGSSAEAGRLRSDLGRMTKLAKRGLRPPALRLARQLPAEAERLKRLREPAGTTATEIHLSFAELLQMSGLRFDPHYLPALIAAGRAYLAASGRDPLTGTLINPEYAGLEAELAGGEARLGRDATAAAKLSARVKRLSGALTRARRRAGRLEHRVGRLRAAARRRPGDGAG